MFDAVIDRISTTLAQKILEMTTAKVDAGLPAIKVAASHAATPVKHGPGRPKKALNAPAAPAIVAKPAKAARKGIKRDMSCRVADCKNVSKGPRFRFMCEEHGKLPKADQIKAVEAYKLKHAARG